MYSYFTQGSGSNYGLRREHLLVSPGIRETHQRHPSLELEDDEFFIAEHTLFGD